MAAGALLVLLVGCGATDPATTVAAPVSPPTTTAATTTTTGGPAAGVVTAAATAGTPASQTRPFVPTTLTLPSGRTAPVDPAGVDAAGRLEVPSDPSRVGRWTGGALVDEPFGSTVLAGHVDSRDQGLGVLVELLDVGLGDVVEVGDGERSRAYVVTAVEQVPRARLAAETDTFDQDVDHRLVLITCVGAYDRVAGAYPDNLVVVAEPRD